MNQIDFIKDSIDFVPMNNVQSRQLDEVLYSISQLSEIYLDLSDAVYIYSIVKMVLDGKYTDDMRM